MPQLIEVKVAFRGAKEIELALSQLPKAMSRAAVLEAMRKAAKPVVADARRRARKRSGAGAKSIAARAIPKSKSTPQKPVGITIAPDKKHFYMMFQEFGTVNIGADPFLRPAWDANREAVLASFEKLMWDAILRKAKLLAKKAAAGTLSTKVIGELTE